MPRTASASVKLSPTDRKKLFAAKNVLDLGLEKKVGLQIPFDVYFQDPLVAKKDPKLAFDKRLIPWEPGLSKGPTSARFAVVDYNADTETLAPPATWDATELCFLHGDKTLDRNQKQSLQFHQVNVWATLQGALDFFQHSRALGRPIPWGFEGNRLIVVPHAGYGENAYYDRQSKSLQFYYYDRNGERSYTCLSADIIHHELGHAILDGIRPLLIESTSVETAAFHEFLGDLTAILITLRNNEFRKRLIEKTGGDLAKADDLSAIAEQFGEEVSGRPYLRTAVNDKKMSDVTGSNSPHASSEVLTGAMFEIILRLSEHYRDRGRTVAQAFWDTIQRMQETALQPLDLLPPVDVTFRDYALAVLRNEELNNPRDPHGHRQRMLDVFVSREILTQAEAKELAEPEHIYDRLKVGVFHSVEKIAGSRTAAYHFLDDNREELFLPQDRDVLVSDLYNASKSTRQGRRLPRQTILEYVWREEVSLDGPGFGPFQGETTTLLCGGTLVFDDCGTVLSWSRKPGRQRGRKAAQKEEAARGAARRSALLGSVEKRLAAGQLGPRHSSDKGLPGHRIAPFTAQTVDGQLRFELSPHLNLSENHTDDDPGERQWLISS